MKTNICNSAMIIVLTFLLFSLCSCTKPRQEGKKDTNQTSENKDYDEESLYKIFEDSTDIYGSGYFDYKDSVYVDTLESYHMGYSIPRDSIYKVYNLKAFEDLNLLIRTTPVTPGPYLDRGNHFQNIHKDREAIDDYNKYIELVPDNQSAYMNRGTAHERLKNYDSALADYSKVIELKPRDTIAFFNRGVVYDALDNPWQAIREYDSVIIIDPRLAKAYYNRGKSYGKIKDYEKAIEDWEKAMELNTMYSEVLTKRINIIKGVLKRAISLYKNTCAEIIYTDNIKYFSSVRVIAFCYLNDNRQFPLVTTSSM